MLPFQYDVGGGFRTTSFDTSPDLDIDEYLVFGTYHLEAAGDRFSLLLTVRF